MDPSSAIFVTTLALSVFGLFFCIRSARRREKRRAELVNLRSRKICAYCGYDLRAGHERCPECGIDPRQREEVEFVAGLPLPPHRLRDDWPAEAIDPRKVARGEPWDVAYVCANDMEADLLIEHLLVRGVPCRRRESIDKVTLDRNGHHIKEISGNIISVPRADMAAAEKIINHFKPVDAEQSS